ncbi:hypothetical protein QE152_g32127 [Popillia japonica]|uniref:Endonuclease/exonuclease/phosphatase domain-containing protein n=1 Tax=Popillia japonica TaxID=7064 RepID=A0AAW1IZW1_POPJA
MSSLWVTVSIVALIHQNVQSLGNSVDRIEAMLMKNSDCYFLCITEHWKSVSQLQTLKIRNFKIAASYCRDERQHGGVAIYVREKIKCCVREKLCNLSIKGVFECAAVDCSINNRRVSVGTIYRPPDGGVSVFFDLLEQFLLGIYKEDTTIIIAGDFNINLLGDSANKVTLVCLMRSFGLSQNHVAQKIVFRLDVVDVTKSRRHFTEPKILDVVDVTKSRRHFTEPKIQEFLTGLSSDDWLEVYNTSSQDVNLQWNRFMAIFTCIFKPRCKFAMEPFYDHLDMHFQ